MSYDPSEKPTGDVKIPIINYPLINSLQIKYFLKNIHSKNLSKYKFKEDPDYNTKIFRDLGYMISEIEKHFNINLNNRTVRVPRNWREVIEYKCSVSKIKSFVNKSKLKNLIMDKSEVREAKFVCIKHTALIGIVDTITNEDIFVKLIDTDTGIINNLPQRYTLEELDSFIPKFVESSDDSWKKSFTE